MDNKLNLSYGATEALFSINGLGTGLENDDEEYSRDFGKYLCWCLVEIHIKNRHFHFDSTDDEMLTLGEVTELRDGLSDLLEDRISDVCTLRFIEPDLKFVLYPKLDLRTIKTMCVREGKEIQDIFGELIINLSDLEYGYNGQSYTFPLNRNDIEQMKNYLDRTIPQLEHQWNSAND